MVHRERSLEHGVSRACWLRLPKLFYQTRRPSDSQYRMEGRTRMTTNFPSFKAELDEFWKRQNEAKIDI